MRTRNERQEQALAVLKRVYPRALTYTDIWNYLLPSATSIAKIDQSGGGVLEPLIKKKQVKRITTGVYCWIPS